MLAPAAPITSSVPVAESTLPGGPTPVPSTAAPAEDPEEAELGSSSTISTSSPTPETDTESSGQAEMQSAESMSTEIAAMVTTESPDGNFDCSATSPADQADATASFLKGSSLVIDDLYDIHLRVSVLDNVWNKIANFRDARKFTFVLIPL